MTKHTSILIVSPFWGFPFWPPGFGQYTAIASIATKFCTAHCRKRYQRPYKAGGTPSRSERTRHSCRTFSPGWLTTRDRHLDEAEFAQNGGNVTVSMLSASRRQTGQVRRVTVGWQPAPSSHTRVLPTGWPSGGAGPPMLTFTYRANSAPKADSVKGCSSWVAGLALID
jgi:hypothetical protein